MSRTTQAVLEALGAAGKRLSTPELAEQLGMALDNVRVALKTLEHRGYARERTTPGAGSRILHWWRITKVGKRALEEGVQITTGPAGPRPMGWYSLRSRVWRALRTCRRATVHELLVLAARGDEADASKDARAYLNALARANYVVRVPNGPGKTPDWFLRRDTGFEAPQWNKRQARVYDPNTREVFDVA
jgi:hypothetical protein